MLEDLNVRPDTEVLHQAGLGQDAGVELLEADAPRVVKTLARLLPHLCQTFSLLVSRQA